MGVNALIRENSQCHTFSTTTMLLLVHTASSYTQLVRTIYLKAPKAASPLKKKYSCSSFTQLHPVVVKIETPELCVTLSLWVFVVLYFHCSRFAWTFTYLKYEIDTLGNNEYTVISWRIRTREVMRGSLSVPIMRPLPDFHGIVLRNSYARGKCSVPPPPLSANVPRCIC